MATSETTLNNNTMVRASNRGESSMIGVRLPWPHTMLFNNICDTVHFSLDTTRSCYVDQVQHLCTQNQKLLTISMRMWDANLSANHNAPFEGRFEVRSTFALVLNPRRVKHCSYNTGTFSLCMYLQFDGPRRGMEIAHDNVSLFIKSSDVIVFFIYVTER